MFEKDKENLTSSSEINNNDAPKDDKTVLSDTQPSSDGPLEQETTVVEKTVDESAFFADFNPNLAFYDDDNGQTETTPLNESQQQPSPVAAEEVSKESTPVAPQTPKTEEPVAVSESKKTFVFAEWFKSKLSRFNKNGNQSASAGKPISTVIKKKPYVLIAGLTVLFAIIVAGGIMFAKGMFPAFASNDVYGLFMDGKLYAASNQQGKIEESIEDFLSYYKTYEAQGDLHNLRITGQYEIRELTGEEKRNLIYKEKKGANATSVSVAQNNETPNSSEQAQDNGNGNSVQSQGTTPQTTATTTAQTTEATTNANGETTHATTNQDHPLNKVDDKIVISKNNEELQNVLFYGSKPKTYKVVEHDNLTKIAKRENLTLTELMVPNPDLLEDSTIGIDQEIKIVKMSGPLKLSFSREVTYTEDIAFKTKEEKTDEMFVGETKITQQGKEGIRQEITKYDYENNVISKKTPVSDDVIEEPTTKIIKVGTKPKTSPEQTSGLADSKTNPPPSTSSGSGYAWPVTGARLTSKFGPRRAPKRGASSYHRGLDLAIKSGTPIYATQSGTVTIASYSGGYGNLVEINHGGGLTSRYGHCLSLKVKRGQKVQKGDVIALVGSTGVSTGPHLHFEIRKNGSAVNPLNYLK